MKLHIAIKTVPGLCKRGTIYDCTEDGMEEMTYHVKPNGHKELAGYTGLILPYTALRDYVFPLKATGAIANAELNRFKKH
jgi:hypothetical protein